jgi:shikimate kinase
VIYLHTSVEQQLKRTVHDRNRPLLQTSDPGGKLRDLMETRDPLYREIADWVVETDGCRARDVVQKIVQQTEQPT